MNNKTRMDGKIYRSLTHHSNSKHSCLSNKRHVLSYITINSKEVQQCQI